VSYKVMQSGCSRFIRPSCALSEESSSN